MMHEIKNTELAALSGEAAAADNLSQPAAAPGEQPQPDTAAAPAPVDRTAEVAMLMGIVRPMIVMALPYIKDAPDGEWQALHEPIGDLLNHYNVDVGEWIKSPWAKLAFAAAPLGMRGFAAWKADAEKPAEQQPQITATSSPAELVQPAAAAEQTANIQPRA